MLCHWLIGAVGTTLPAPRLKLSCNYLYSRAVYLITDSPRRQYTRQNQCRAQSLRTVCWPFGTDEMMYCLPA